MKFTKETLDRILDTLIDLYENTDISMKEAIGVVKKEYKKEIKTLPEKCWKLETEESGSSLYAEDLTEVLEEYFKIARIDLNDLKAIEEESMKISKEINKGKVYKANSCKISLEYVEGNIKEFEGW